MIKTQVQIPDELFERAKKVAAAKEWSFAELVRRGLEQMTSRYPAGEIREARAWKLPAALDLDLREDPFGNEAWREEINLGSGASRAIADRLREEAARYESGE